MKERVVVLVPVWGGEFADRFADLALPSLTAVGNLEAFSDDLEAIVFHCDKAANQRLRENGSVDILNRYAPVVLLEEESPFRFSYNEMSWRLNRCFDQWANVSRRFFVTLCDMVWQTGSIAAMLGPEMNVADAILVTGIRVRQKKFLEGEKRVLDNLRYRELVSSGMHRLYLDCRLEAEKGQPGVGVYMAIEGDDLILRNYQPWPALFRLRDVSSRIPMDQTLDHEFLELAGSASSVSLVESSDRIAFLEISPDGYDQFGSHDEQKDFDEHCLWLRRWTTPTQRIWSQVDILMRGCAPTVQDQRVASRSEIDAWIRELNSSTQSVDGISCYRRYFTLGTEKGSFNGVQENGWLRKWSCFEIGEVNPGDVFVVSFVIPFEVDPENEGVVIAVIVEGAGKLSIEITHGEYDYEFSFSERLMRPKIELSFNRSAIVEGAGEEPVCALARWNEMKLIPQRSTEHAR